MYKRQIYWGLRPYEAAATAEVLAVMSLSMMAYTISTLQQQYCFATEQGKPNLWMQCLLTGIQVAFTALALIVPASYGVIVICLGMVVSNSLLALVFLAFVHRQIGGLNLGAVVWLHLRLWAAALLGGLPAYLTARFVVWAMPEVLIAQYAALLAGGLAFCVGFLLGVKMLRISEFQIFAQRITAKLHRGR